MGGEAGLFEDKRWGDRLRGLILVARASQVMGDSDRAMAEAGAEHYAQSGDAIRGALARVSLQHRFAGGERFDMRFGAHSLGIAGRNVDVDLRYAWDWGQWRVQAGLAREVMRDSLLAIKGAHRQGQAVGAARLDTVSAEIAGGAGPWAFEITPALGNASSAHDPSNPYAGLGGEARGVLSQDDDVTWRFVATGRYDAFAEARSRQFHPTLGDTGGYDSPRQRWRQAAKIAFNTATGSTHYLYADMGPLWQWRLADVGHESTRTGWTARGFYQFARPDSLRVQAHLLWEALGPREDRWESRVQIAQSF